MFFRTLFLAILISMSNFFPSDFNKIKANNLDQIESNFSTKFDKSDYEGALKEINKLIKLNPKKWQYFHNRGLIKYRLEDMKGANADFSKAIKLNQESFNQSFYYRGFANYYLENYEKSILDFTKALDLGLDKFAQEDVFFLMGSSKYIIGDFVGAISYFSKVIELNPKSVFAYNQRGKNHELLGNIKSAIDDYKNALLIEPKNKISIENLNNLSYSLQKKVNSIEEEIDIAEEKKDYKKIIDLYKEKIFIGDQTDVLDPQPYQDIAYQYYRLGNYEKAISYISKAISLEKSLNGNVTSNYAFYLDGLALYYRQGKLFLSEEEFKKILPLLDESLNIKKVIYGNQNVKTADGYYQLANLYSQKGKLYKAIKLRKESIEILENLNEVKNFHMTLDDFKTLIYFSISVDFQNIGDLKNALKYSLKSLEINEKLLDKNDLKLAENLESIAGIYFSMADFDESKSYLKRASKIFENKNKKDRFISTKNSLKILSFIKNDKYSSPKLISKKFKNIHNNIPKDDPSAVFKFKDNAFINLLNGNYKNAISNLNKAKDYILENRGEDNFQIVGIYTDLGRAFLLSENLKEAEEHLVKATQLYNAISNDIRRPEMNLIYENFVLLYLTKKDFNKAQKYIEKLFENKILYVKEQSQYFPVDQREDFNKFSLIDNSLIFSLSENLPMGKELAFKARLNRHGLLEDIEKYQSDISNLKESDKLTFDNLSLIDSQLSDLSIIGNERSKLNSEKRKIENIFYSNIPTFKPKIIEINDIKKVLPNKSVLVEFQKYKPVEFISPLNFEFRDDQYIALVLNSNGDLNFIELGSAEKIEKLISDALYSTKEYFDDADLLWKELGNIILNPIIDVIGDSDTLFISPDGELNRVPFSALKIENSDRYLVDKYNLRLITTGRELLTLEKQENSNNNKSIVIANPFFDSKGISTNQNYDFKEKRSNLSQLKQWRELPYSEREGEVISNLINGELVVGDKASSTFLIQKESPQIIHIASHAEFLSDQKDEYNPLLKGRIIFAGANNPNSFDDGILTALEITRLNWKETDLVVISACDSGLGEIKSGEGLYGLKRAINIAGAKSSLLSLWRVDDEATSKFMESFYIKLKEGQGKADALANTQKEFRNSKKYSHPNVWAAFQLSGDWRSIKFDY